MLGKRLVKKAVSYRSNPHAAITQPRPPVGKSFQMTEMACVMPYVMVSGVERRRKTSSWRTNRQNVKRDSKPLTLTSHPTLRATTVAETAMLRLDC